MKPIQRVSMILLKYAPMIAGFLMWCHVTALLCGVNLPFADTTIGLPPVPCITCIIWSKAFGFCPLHRYFIGYAGIVTCCIKWQACFVGFGLALPVIRWIVFGIGIFLFGWFIIDQLKEYGKFSHSGFV